MKRIQTLLTAIILLVVFTSCTGQDNTKKEPITQSYITHTSTAHHKVALEVLKASKEWIEAFNNGDAKACVAPYYDNAIMSAMPFGIKKGIKEITEFWVPFIASGATDLVYTNVGIEVVDENTAFLSANWSMNVGRGIIYSEKWEKKDGKWGYSYDNFEVLERYETPRDNSTVNPVASHIDLENIIKKSMEWIDGFNSGKGDVCGNGYFENATMNAIPFATVNGKENIEAFWTKLIADRATNLIYHNPTFKAITDNSATLSSMWSMNIGEGKIYQEKWEKKDGKWELTYDEFQVLKQY